MSFAVLPGLNIYWHLPILIVVISLVYSATRHDHWPAIFHETVRWMFNMSGFLVAIGAVLFLMAWFIP